MEETTDVATYVVSYYSYFQYLFNSNNFVRLLASAEVCALLSAILILIF